MMKTKRSEAGEKGWKKVLCSLRRGGNGCVDTQLNFSEAELVRKVKVKRK